MSSFFPSGVSDHSPQKKIDELIGKYQKVDAPGPIVLDLLNNSDSYCTLINALRRHISLAKCRSPNLEDGQITVYDKALLILSNYGDRVTDPGVIALYLTEFLGVVPIAATENGKDVVASHVELQCVLERVRATHEMKAVEDPFKKEESELEEANLGIHDDYKPYVPETHHNDDEEMKYTPELEGPAMPDVRVARLLEVYQQAKEDYLREKERYGVESLPAVRFLRDTAENTLRYLHDNGLSGHAWVPDLEETFAAARDRTVQLLGGRKRHFDEGRWGRRSRKRGRRIVDSYRPREGGQ